MTFQEYFVINQLKHQYKTDKYFRESFDIIFNDENLLIEASLLRRLQYISIYVWPLFKEYIIKHIINYISKNKKVLRNDQVFQLFNKLFWEYNGIIKLKNELDDFKKIPIEKRTDILADLIKLAGLIHFPINTELKNIVKDIPVSVKAPVLQVKKPTILAQKNRPKTQNINLTQTEPIIRVDDEDKP